jgi:hypothetical protein
LSGVISMVNPQILVQPSPGNAPIAFHHLRGYTDHFSRFLHI